eukprot:9478950-Pyramimonas_sp.AAC.2
MGGTQIKGVMGTSKTTYVQKADDIGRGFQPETPVGEHLFGSSHAMLGGTVSNAVVGSGGLGGHVTHQSVGMDNVYLSIKFGSPILIGWKDIAITEHPVHQ